MRKLMIRFSTEGEYFREINEDRNYFLAEAEEVVDNVRRRLKKEKRVVDPKTFECWIEGERLILTHVKFEDGQTIEKQLEETMLNTESWEEETKHKYINKLKEYALKERELFINKEFKAFAVRFDQLLGNEDVQPFPFLLDTIKLKDLFNGIHTSISAGFYSELESVIVCIHAAYKKTVDTVHQELLEAERKKTEEAKDTGQEKEQGDSNDQRHKNLDHLDHLKDRVLTWFGNEENFQSFKRYVTGSYQSVSETRVDALCPRFLPYQELQAHLFKERVKEVGFDAVCQLHEALQRDFKEKYTSILSGGFVLGSDELVESLVLAPVIQRFTDQLNEELKQETDEEGGMTEDAEGAERKQVAVSEH